MAPNKFIRVTYCLSFGHTSSRFGQLPVLTIFSAMKPEVEVGANCFLIRSLESLLLPFVRAYFRSFS